LEADSVRAAAWDKTEAPKIRALLEESFLKIWNDPNIDEFLTEMDAEVGGQ
jgi:hypothetical protein